MRREGRQLGWVRVYDRALVDPEVNRRAVHVVDGPAMANGGFIRAPRKPTSQSKSGGLRALRRNGLTQEEEEEEEEEPQALPPVEERFGYHYSTGWQSPFKYELTSWQGQYWRMYDPVEHEEVHARPPPPARFAGRASCKGSRKFKHDEIKMHYVDAADVVDEQLDYLHDSDS